MLATDQKGGDSMSRTPEGVKARYAAEIEAGKQIGHAPKIEGVTMDDTCVCSCGWQSGTYWDGREYAHAEWVSHIQTQGAMIVYPRED